MASVPGGQYSFFANGQNINVATPDSGGGLPAPVLGDFNLELMTSGTVPSDPPPGYQGVALLANDGRTIDLVAGNYGVQVTKGGPHTVIGGTGNDTIYGGHGRDLIMGGQGADQLFGGNGPDTITGGSGPDTIWGGNGRDLIMGGTGADTIFAGHGGDLIKGGSGSDVIFGNDGRDTIFGGSGPDTIYAGQGPALIHGGAGADLIVGGRNDTIYGGSGADTIDGGSGHNMITTGSGGSLIQDTGVRGHDTVVGFNQAHGDAIAFVGETAASIDHVVATANVSGGNTTITLPDGSTMKLIGITHIDSSFFH